MAWEKKQPSPSNRAAGEGTWTWANSRCQATVGAESKGRGLRQRGRGLSGRSKAAPGLRMRRQPGAASGALQITLALASARARNGLAMAGLTAAALLAACVTALLAAADPDQPAAPEEPSRVRPMTAANWTLVMEGEWMLKL